jgi:hypothetical protein
VELSVLAVERQTLVFLPLLLMRGRKTADT